MTEESSQSIQNRLPENESRLRSIFLAAPVGIGLVADRIIKDANDRLCDMTGYSRDELVGRNARIFYPSDEDYNYVGSEKYRQIAEKGTGSVETRWRRKDGAIIDVMLSSAPIDPSDLSRGVTFTAIDITERKIAETKLRESEKKLRLVTDRMNDMIWTIDLALRTTYVSPSVKKLLGFTPEERMLQDVKNQMTVESLSRVIETVANEMEREKEPGIDPDRTIKIEVEYYHKNGSRVWCENIVGALRDEKGGLIGAYGVSRDITERKHAEEALRESENKFRLTFNFSPDSVNINRLENGLYVDINEGFTKLTGFTREDAIGKTSAEIGIWHDLADRQKLVKQLKETGICENLEAVFRRKDGSLGTGLMSARIIHLKNMPYIISITRDITERKRAEEELRYQQGRFYNLIHNAPFGMLMINKSEKFTYTNPKFTEIFGYDLKDVPDGKRWFDLAYPDPEYRKEVLSAWIEDLEAYGPGEKRPRIFDVNCKDGSLKTIHFFPVQLEKGENLVACEDITERTTLENQLRQAQKMESVGRLAGGVAHDFNNMLQAIIGYAELAMIKNQQGTANDEDLIQISRAAQRAADLVGKLLAFARKQAVNPRVLDLNRTVESMIEMLTRVIGEDIRLIWKPGSDPWPVKIDPVQIDQILANLLVNARDAITGVGQVTIETGNAVLDESYCRANPGSVLGEYALLTVSDSGSGMDQETVSHIFEPFFTTKEIGKGTGLGLAMVYGIVKQNKGFISVQSEPGCGTTFKIYLPRCYGQAETEAAAQEQISLGGKETVLAVEDEKMLLEFVVTILEELGYKVLAAETPEDALIMAREYKNPIHLLLTDVIMPGMNGHEVRAAIVNLYPDIKTIYMSGYTADIMALKGIIDEGMAYLQKPFSINSLALKVREVLDG
jgi:two-component system, cell cycle sensor histidine kinase and response regulator CckA